MFSNAHLLTIRRATSADHEVLSDLAGLDSARPLHGEVLVAEAEDGPIAALELETDRSVGDPFQRSDQAVGLLRMRADQIRVRAPRARRRNRRRAFPRLAGAHLR
jgi:hypothetical protein